MLVLMVGLLFQVGVDAGPDKASCGDFPVTLQAFPIGTDDYTVNWDGSFQDDIYLVVQPDETTVYRVDMIDHNTGRVYSDEVRVLVHPDSPDLDGDSDYTQNDFALLLEAWPGVPPTADFDPDGDGTVTLLDSFYFCNFDIQPPNTPPRVIVANNTVTTEGDSVIIEHMVEDDEQVGSLVIDTQPANGFAFVLNGLLRYTPADGFIGVDSFRVFGTDGFLDTQPIQVFVEVIAPDSWSNIFQEIIIPHCQACHVDAVSGGLSMATYSLTEMGGKNGAGFVAGFPNLSELYLRTADGTMPPDVGPLSDLDIERIRLWIAKGAQP
ncbi:MAG: Ig-like domain-containing protein [Acidobacteriota bacterium]|nr:Ig-like domain-containing protein [Acidobacteriota bacterium]